MGTKKNRHGANVAGRIGTSGAARSDIILPKGYDVDKAHLLRLYLRAFVPDLEAPYAISGPVGAKHWTTKNSGPSTVSRVTQALEGVERRLSVQVEGRAIRGSTPVSIAVSQHRDGLATAAAIDVDHGGQEAIKQGLIFLSTLGLFAFGTLSTSVKEDGSPRHDGGHLWIIFDRPQSADMLRNLAQRVALAADLDGESYPSGQKLRPPLMHQLRAPSGPQRFPILLQSGEVIDPNEGGVWQAIERLFAPDVWKPNAPRALSDALEQLPPLKASQNGATSRPRHKSNVNPNNSESVIDWYNQNHRLEELLQDAGADLSELRGTSGAIRCPFHDDRNPSFLIWYHDELGDFVGQCRNPSCRAYIEHKKHYLDAFGVYRLMTGESYNDAVKNLSERYNLGTKRTYRATVEKAIEAGPSTVEAHLARVEKERAALLVTIRKAAQQRGKVTVINAIMGLGKTHTGHEVAEELHRQGQRVAIVAPNHAHAQNEWGARLGALGFVWQPKSRLCTCHDRQTLAKLGALGYRLPNCDPLNNCPYQAQHDQKEGKITVYQYNHLHNNDGELLTGYDVIFIDESPASSLLEAHTVGHDDIRTLLNRLNNRDELDPAFKLVKALYRTAKDTKPTNSDLRGAGLVDVLGAYLNDEPLLELIAEARQSGAAHKHPAAPDNIPASALPPIFFGKMLDALERTAKHPEHGDGLAWGLKQGGGGVWTWYEPHTMGAKWLDRLDRPAVIVLDGSAQALPNERIFKGWEVETVTHDIPLSPTVEIVQVDCTAHTRRMIKDEKRLERTAQYIGMVAYQEGRRIEGGVTYKAAKEPMSAALGGDWLHYGGQRGRNDLSDKGTIALIGSPTIPPNALERMTLALFPDGPPLERGPDGMLWERLGAGDYRAYDERLEAINRLHGPEELRQAAHRVRLVLATKPKLVIIGSTWDLTPLGLAPHRRISELPTTHSNKGKELWEAYQAMPQNAEGLISSPSNEYDNVRIDPFSTCLKDKGLSLPHVEKEQKRTCPEKQAATSEEKYKPVVMHEGGPTVEDVLTFARAGEPQRARRWADSLGFDELTRGRLYDDLTDIASAFIEVLPSNETREAGALTLAQRGHIRQARDAIKGLPSKRRGELLPVLIRLGNEARGEAA